MAARICSMANAVPPFPRHRRTSPAEYARQATEKLLAILFIEPRPSVKMLLIVMAMMRMMMLLLAMRVKDVISPSLGRMTRTNRSGDEHYLLADGVLLVFRQTI
jgi:hypothetical protein